VEVTPKWPVVVVLLVILISLPQSAFAALVNESKGPGGFGWQQAYGGSVPNFARLTASADRDTYDYGYKNIQVFVRLEDYWAQDCGWWYVIGGRTITVTLSNGTTTVNSSGVTTDIASKGGGTITYDWTRTNFDTTAPGRWLVTADDGAGGNFTGGDAMQFYIYIRGQLNVTNIATTGSAVGSNVVIDATVKDHTGREVIGEMTDNMANNVTPTVTAYVTGPSGTLTVPLGWTGTVWQGTWAGADVTDPGNHKIIVRATDGHDYWIDGRGRSKDIAISGVFPSSFTGGLWLPVLVAIFLLAGRRWKGGGPLFFVVILSFLLIFSAPAGVGDDGRYTESRPTGLELEGDSTSTTGACSDIANLSCHLLNYDFPARGTTGEAAGATLNVSEFADATNRVNISHPGEGRTPAGFYATWVHQQHGRDVWVAWRFNLTDPAGTSWFSPFLPITEPRWALESPTRTVGIRDDEVTSRWGTASGIDHSIGRVFNEIGYNTANDSFWWDSVDAPSPPFYLTGGVSNDGAPKNMDLPSCTAGVATDEGTTFGGGSYGCHGFDSADTTLKPRLDPVSCTKCHTGVTATSTNSLHGTAAAGGSCTDCHNGSTIDDSDQLDGDASTDVKPCYETACHSSSRLGVTEINVTGGHAGKDCRFCHGHGHNITKENDWNTSCGSDDVFCHGTGSAVPVSGGVTHEVSGGNTPTCVECHGSVTAHNITIPACSKCHNTTGAGGVSAVNGTGTVPGWDDSNLFHNGSRNSTGDGMVCVNCHNSSSYHSEPGFVNANTTSNGRCISCHSSTLGNLRPIIETHSNQSCGACHNSDTVSAASMENGPRYLYANLHSTGVGASRNITPYGFEALNDPGDWAISDCTKCHNKSSEDWSQSCDGGGCHESFEIHRVQMGLAGPSNKDGTHAMGGGANCTTLGCHGGSANSYINATSFNQTSVHRGLNNATAVPPGTPTYMSACYACHENGTAPEEGKHNNDDQIGGFLYNNPATCEVCHLNVTGYYENVTILTTFNAPQVKEHFPRESNTSAATFDETDDDYVTTNSSGGTDARINSDTGRNATCEQCHINDVVNHNDTNLGLGSSPTLKSQRRDNISHYGGNTTLINGSECLQCHGSGAGADVNRSKYGVGAYDIYASNPRSDHTGYTTIASCDSCHNNAEGLLGLHAEELNVKGGNASCTNPGCHMGSDTPTYADVDLSAFNKSIHRWINNASLYSGNESIEYACRGCHVVEGGQAHKNKDPPYFCWDCHNSTSAYGNVTNAPFVAEHFRNGSDLNITSFTGSLNQSCVACHNKTEMKYTFNEVDSGAGGNGSYANVSHYGRKRPDLYYVENNKNVTSCTYCHWNSSTEFSDVMAASNHTLMLNHTDRPGGPTCSNDTACHSQGRMHDAGLTKPAYNNTLCTTCHDSTSRQNHSASKSTGGVNCTSCHTNTTSNGFDIHGTNGTYLQDNGGSYGDNLTAVNCSTCHQNTSTILGLTTNPPRVNMPMNHSNNESSGQLWGDYWSDTDQNSSCYYCHGDTRHNATGLGNVSVIRGAVNNSISNSSSSWCRACHYNESASGLYIGQQFTPAPPDIANRTGAEEASLPNYYENHSSSYLGNDSTCLSCHKPSPEPANISDFMHNVKIGVAGGANCTSCHDIGGSAPVKVNVSAMNSTNAIHAQLNNRTGDNGTDVPSATSDQNNRKCWACHSNGTNPEEGHNKTVYKDPWTCPDCHVNTTSPIYGKFNWSARTITDVTEHFLGGSDIQAATTSSANKTSCIDCHQNTSIWEMLLPNASVNDPDTGSFDPYGTGGGGNLSASHYGRINGTGLLPGGIIATVGGSAVTNCSYCHQNTSTLFGVVMDDSAYHTNIPNHNNSEVPYCTNSSCHGAGRLHDSGLTVPFLNSTDTSGGMYNSDLCKDCHSDYQVHGADSLNADTLECASCHSNPSIYNASTSSDVLYATNTYDRATRNDNTGNESMVDARVGDPPEGMASLNTEPRLGADNLVSGVASTVVNVLYSAAVDVLVTIFDSIQVSKEVTIPTQIDTTGAAEAAKVVINRAASEPEFIINGKDKKIVVSVTSPDGTKRKLDKEIIETGEGYSIKLEKDRSFKPGIYKLQVETTENGVTTTTEQDFAWGVLALNTHKSVYTPDEQAYIGIGVLDNEGKMVCDADVTLTITDPEGDATTLSTANGKIYVSEQCEYYGVTDLPDYYTYYTTGGTGTYTMELSAITKDGTRELADTFEVKQSVPYDVVRTGPTRIYPLVPNTMEFTIKPGKDYTGPITEYVPAGFEITPQEGMEVTKEGDTKALTWDKKLTKGKINIIEYEFDAPDVSPEFYVLGPLEIGSWAEARQWQIASDPATFTCSRYIYNVTACGTLACNQSEGEPVETAFANDSSITLKNDQKYRITIQCDQGGNGVAWQIVGEINETGLSTTAVIPLDADNVWDAHGFSEGTAPVDNDAGDGGASFSGGKLVWNPATGNAYQGDDRNQWVNFSYIIAPDGAESTDVAYFFATETNEPYLIDHKITITWQGEAVNNAPNIVRIDAPANDTWNGTSPALINFLVYVDDDSGFTNLTLYNTSDGTALTSNTSAVQDAAVNVLAYTFTDDGTYQVYANATDDDASPLSNQSVDWTVKIDTTAPAISATNVNDTSISQNEYFCVNATVSDAQGNIESVIAEINDTTATLVNYSMSEDGTSCDGTGADGVYGAEIQATTSGTWNFTRVYANDTLNNPDYTYVTPEQTITVAAKPIFRYYVNFDLSSIPSGASITLANLTINITDPGDADSGEVHRVASSYDSTSANDTIHDSPANLVDTFDPTSTGTLNITVTSAVSTAFTTDNQDYVAFQIREAGEDQNFTIAGNGSTNNDKPKLYIEYSTSAKKQIHGINYMTRTGGYSSAWDNTSAANCTSCHDSGGSISYVNGTATPRVPSPMMHSNGTMWNQTPGYWVTADNMTACDYCHGDTKHNGTALGNSSAVVNTNSVNSSLTNTSSTWCKSCHYNDSTSDYKGDLFSPRPPEISNDTGYFESQFPDLYTNHSGAGYLGSDLNGNDSTCYACHKGSVGGTEGMDVFMHKVSTGVSGSLNCTSCHDLNNANAPKHVNFSAMNRTDAIHAQLNNKATTAPPSHRPYPTRTTGSAGPATPTEPTPKTDTTHPSTRTRGPVMTATRTNQA
jgi:hypothetical protein